MAHIPQSILYLVLLLTGLHCVVGHGVPPSLMTSGARQLGVSMFISIQLIASRTDQVYRASGWRVGGESSGGHDRRGQQACLK